MSQGQKTNKPILLHTDTGDISGTLLLPDSTSTPTVALIISGSGPTDRDGNFPMMSNNSLKMLAEGLQAHGIASVRFDKRGIGESRLSGFSETEITFEHYVNDVKAWVKLLRGDSRFGDIILIGHSEGSLIGMIASREEGVSRFISLAGAGFPANQLIYDQLREQPSFVREKAIPILEQLQQGELVEEVPQELFALFRPSVQPYLISWFQYDPAKEISRLDCPILIVQGTTDIQIDLKHAEKLAISGKNTQKTILEGMNHILKPASDNKMENLGTYGDPKLPLKEELVPIIVEFVKEK
ncbi:alpha/beta hydrolase [Flagellimonas nanhaiensis]|nr:alpha/beta hydrolase [Allomuricauda nanhaiensis]